MSTVEPMADPQDAVEVPSTVDARTLQILDLIGLTLAFLASTLLLEQAGRSDAVGSQVELLVFCVSLPAWVVVAKLYGLCDYDEERTDHSTADDLVGVGHLGTGRSKVFLMGNGSI